MTNVALVDVKNVDGEVWQVAGVAGAQTQAALELAEEALESFWWAARGSWLSQESYRTGSMPDGDEYVGTAAAKRLLRAQKELSRIKDSLKPVQLSASHDPRSY